MLFEWPLPWSMGRSGDETIACWLVWSTPLIHPYMNVCGLPRVFRLHHDVRRDML